jgi:hypothetical protein
MCLNSDRQWPESFKYAILQVVHYLGFDAIEASLRSSSEGEELRRAACTPNGLEGQAIDRLTKHPSYSIT